jgi:hypothetical protein
MYFRVNPLFVFACSMMVAVVEAVAMADGLSLEATVPAWAEVATYPVPAIGPRTSARTTVGARQTVT